MKEIEELKKSKKLVEEESPLFPKHLDFNASGSSDPLGYGYKSAASFATAPKMTSQAAGYARITAGFSGAVPPESSQVRSKDPWTPLSLGSLAAPSQGYPFRSGAAITEPSIPMSYGYGPRIPVQNPDPGILTKCATGPIKLSVWKMTKKIHQRLDIPKYDPNSKKSESPRKPYRSHPYSKQDNQIVNAVDQDDDEEECPKEISYLLSKGHLKELLGRKKIKTQEVDKIPQRAASPPQDAQIINFISGGSDIYGTSYSSAKTHAKEYKSEQGDRPARTSTLTQDKLISFDESDRSHVQDPHHDSLVDLDPRDESGPFNLSSMHQLPTPWAVIRIESDKPVQQKRIKFTPEKNVIIQEEVDKLLKTKMIREVEYPKWLANVVVVQKKNGKWRVCVDYTDLNKACPKDPFPHPHIDVMVDATAGHEMLTFMDASAGFQKFQMEPCDQEHTTFMTLTVLRKPEMSGRMAKWAVKLSAYDIKYTLAGFKQPLETPGLNGLLLVRIETSNSKRRVRSSTVATAIDGGDANGGGGGRVTTGGGDKNSSTGIAMGMVPIRISSPVTSGDAVTVAGG
ncbi:hypothetical protein SSX86_001799 [Deinandra increscens subsp. villosa]|uniref:Reverse transcriptase domain-containing protein n=1 Tax=Deinandra increscens subsp. villosa TaxID=3103831 RepID=A0AAP0DZP8_9ASTR